MGVVKTIEEIEAILADMKNKNADTVCMTCGDIWTREPNGKRCCCDWDD